MHAPSLALASLGLALATAATAATAAHAQAPSPAATDAAKPAPAVQISWDVKIPMRDGVRLSATVYRDPAQTRPVPVIFAMTPYIASHGARQGLHFARHGYVFVIADSRGRGNSDGVFVPGQVEAKDGYDAIEWLAKQPWSDGQVALWGGSWLGFTQWSIAKERPPHLKAIAPSASVHPGVDYPQAYGIFESYSLRWLTFVHGRALNDGLFSADDLWRDAELQQLRRGLPFQELERLTGATGTVWRTWLAHPREDAFWRALTPGPEDYAKLRIPVLTITGHYDADQLGALTYYGRHMAHGAKDATARHWLVIGPWDHSGTRRPKAELGGVTFGPGAVMDLEALHVAWYDHVLKRRPVPAFLKDRVACFVMGKNEWVYARELAQLEGAPLTLALDAAGAAAGDVLRGGRLIAQAPAAAASVAVVSDPRYVPPLEQLTADRSAYALRDQAPAYADLRGQVAWHGAPLPADTVLAGRPRLALQLAVDQPDADLRAELSEVHADGTATLLSRTAVRLRYRKGTTEAAPMTPGKPERVVFPPFDFFARSLAKGSRLRLVINAGPEFGTQRNSHTGGDLATEPASKARVATVTLMTGPGTGSALELPRPGR